MDFDLGIFSRKNSLGQNDVDMEIKTFKLCSRVTESMACQSFVRWWLADKLQYSDTYKMVCWNV